MYEVDWARAKLPLFEHQKEGVRFLLNHRYAALLDEMGAGKTAQVIFTACILYQHQEIDTVVVVCPAAVKHGWKDLQVGEVVKHVWVPAWVGHYGTASDKVLPYTEQTRSRLYWLVTNYEFIRQESRLKELVAQLKGRKVMIIADEGSFIKTYSAQQTKATITLRRKVGARAYLLNGSPVTNNLDDLYSQMDFLDPGILGCKNWWAFRGRYCVLKDNGNYKKIIGYRNTDDLFRRTKPYVLRRLKKDCLDLPEKLYQVVPVQLQPETWRIYREMRDSMIAYLTDQGPAAVTLHTIVKLLRLAQICSGFIGGVEGEPHGEVKEIGTEKLAAFTGLLATRLESDPYFRLVAWCRFRAERERLARELRTKVQVFQIYGGQPERERTDAIREFTSGTAKNPVVLLGQPQAGGFGLNLVTSAFADYLSNDFNYLTRVQSEDRQHRPGQRLNVLYSDYLAEGPQGQRTIDHTIYYALKRKEDFAAWSCAHWVRELQAEDPAGEVAF